MWKSADCGLIPPICAAWMNAVTGLVDAVSFLSLGGLHSKHDWKHRSSCICEYVAGAAVDGRIMAGAVW